MGKFTLHLSGLKKVPSHCSGQVDSPSGQVTFHSYLPNGQGIGIKLRLAQVKQTSRAT